MMKDCFVDYTAVSGGGWKAEILQPVHQLADPRLNPPKLIATGIGPTREEALSNARRAL